MVYWNVVFGVAVLCSGKSYFGQGNTMHVQPYRYAMFGLWSFIVVFLKRVISDYQDTYTVGCVRQTLFLSFNWKLYFLCRNVIRS